MNEHVLRARQIADALDSPNPERTLHEQFYGEWKAWEAEDPTRTMADFNRALGRSKNYAQRIVRFVTASPREGTPWGSGSNKRENVVATVLRDRPEVIATALAQAEPEVQAMIVAAVPAPVRVPPRSEADPLPRSPMFASAFWRAVNTVDAAHAELEAKGLGDMAIEPEAREAAERLARKAGELAAAVIERDNERSMS